MNNFIEWETLKFRKKSGKEKMRCPSCDNQRTDKKDTSLLINHSDGYGKCFYCEALTFREDKSKEVKQKDYKLPIQTWKNYTTLSDKMVKYLESRKISQSTAINLKWTEEKYYQPKIGKNVSNLVFNYFEKDVLVNKKYRDGAKNFTQSAGTRSIFYNINSVIGADEVWIVEGEIDVASLYEVGIKSAISVPNGANDNDDYWKNSEEYLKDVKKFIIAVDNDEKGNALKERIAQRLGRYRCEYIEFENKDANDDLKCEILHNTIKRKQRFAVSGTFKVSDLKNGILDLYENGLPKTIYPKSNYFKGMKDVFSVMRGQLSVGTGIPSHGKSNFTDWLVLNLIKDYDLKASWFSPEHSPMELYHTNLMEKVIGRNFWKDKQTANNSTAPRITKEEITQYEEWANEKIYLTSADGGVLPTWDWLLDKFKEQMFSFGIDIFVIDAFNKVLLPPGNRLEQINIVLTKLTHFAQSNNVIVYLVAHPTKMQKNEAGVYGVPTLYDVSGSADFRNQTHNGYSIYRNWEDAESGIEEGTDFYNMKTKFNFQGSIGEKISFKYSAVNGRYYVKDTHEPLESLITGNHAEEKESVYLTPEEAFTNDVEEDNDIPF